MGIISYTHTLKELEMFKFLSMVGLSVLGLASNALAVDPAWFTDAMTQFSAIEVMVGTVITAVVAIKIAPIVWHYIKPILFRG
jgi:hypothetical protein